MNYLDTQFDIPATNSGIVEHFVQTAPQYESGQLESLDDKIERLADMIAMIATDAQIEKMVDRFQNGDNGRFVEVYELGQNENIS